MNCPKCGSEMEEVYLSFGEEMKPCNLCRKCGHEEKVK